VIKIVKKSAQSKTISSAVLSSNLQRTVKVRWTDRRYETVYWDHV